MRIVWRPAVAVHWRRQLVYFSTSRDQVHRISLNVTGQYGAAAVGAARRRARTPAVTQAAAPGAKVVYQAGSGPSGAGLRLSVDWLYDRLYVADQSTVSTLHSHLPVAMATAPPGVGACVCSHLLDDAARSYPANGLMFLLASHNNSVFVSYFLFTFLAVHFYVQAIQMPMFMVLSSRQSHCESSPGSFDECRTAPSGRRPSDQANNLGCKSACTCCHSLHPPSLFIIITQPES